PRSTMAPRSTWHGRAWAWPTAAAWKRRSAPPCAWRTPAAPEPLTRTTSMKHVARKRFGQNFLTDAQVLNNIIDVIAPRRGQVMVEIGPGLAAMTALLIKQLDHMHVVELDRDLVARLEKAY